MTDPRQIPHLLQLLDDDTPEIKNRILHELASFGPTLKEELGKLSAGLTPFQRESLRTVFAWQKRVWLKQVWPLWLKRYCRGGDTGLDYEKLEKGASILAVFLSDLIWPDPAHSSFGREELILGTLFDKTARTYIKKYGAGDPKKLAYFLFEEKGLTGDAEGQFNPEHNNLIHVIYQKKGSPVSLAAVYMLVGRRLGLTIEGCDFPGHFLARFNIHDRSIYVDCFNGGQLLGVKDLMYVEEQRRLSIRSILQERVGAETILRCFLSNLVRAYQCLEDEENSRLMISLAQDLDQRAAARRFSQINPDDIIKGVSPRFPHGEVICHKRYGYRGIIVDADSECRATDAWYYANQTQPSRFQPWYHVLVHKSDQATYVAQDHLQQDRTKERIEHPLVAYFFEESSDGRYIRNRNPWPEADF